MITRVDSWISRNPPFICREKSYIGSICKNPRITRNDHFCDFSLESDNLGLK